MPSESGEVSRTKEIIDICLRTFIEKGLYETTCRDLSAALKMQPGGLYYHFKNKDDVVLACAEEASIRLEEVLLLPALELADDADHLSEQPQNAAEEMQAMMRFFAQVCTANRYQEQMKPILCRIRERETAYCEKFARKIGCSADELAPWFFAAIAFSQSYMIFGSDAYSVKPLDFARKTIRNLRLTLGKATAHQAQM